MNKIKTSIIAIVLMVLAGVTFFAVHKNPEPLKIGAGVTAQGFLDKPVIDPVSPTSPTSASCSLGGSSVLSSVDGTTRVARLTWSATAGTAGLIKGSNGWFGYVPTATNSTASESFSVPIVGSVTFTMTASSGRATSTCAVTLS